MNSRLRISILLITLAVVSQSCGLYTSSNHKTEDYKQVFADASAGNLEAVRAAVDKDKSVIRAREWDNATLLHLAIQQNRNPVAKYLLDEGADVNAVTTDCLTPLHMAAQNGNIEMIQLLLDRKAKINAVDSKGWTPLDRAMKWGHPDAVEFLRHRGGGAT